LSDNSVSLYISNFVEISGSNFVEIEGDKFLLEIIHKSIGIQVDHVKAIKAGTSGPVYIKQFNIK
jgi:hypothetical protein